MLSYYALEIKIYESEIGFWGTALEINSFDNLFSII